MIVETPLWRGFLLEEWTIDVRVGCPLPRPLSLKRREEQKP